MLPVLKHTGLLFSSSISIPYKPLLKCACKYWAHCFYFDFSSRCPKLNNSKFFVNWVNTLSVLYFCLFGQGVQNEITAFVLTNDLDMCSSLKILMLMLSQYI